MLFAYMACFSFAYLSLGAGTGALVLFGAVQLTMFIAALRAGEHFGAWSWAGLVLAVGGLIYLVSPGITAPDPIGALLMISAGIAWGLYSLFGRGGGDPLGATANNFLFAVPLVILVSLVFRSDFAVSRQGLLLAMASGAIASGLGYAIWYAALKGLSGTHAATVQLSVPVIAAFGGVVLLSEAITLRLLVASAATLGGVAIVLAQRAAK
jgi:drug/metabolite transporter (DMT)-like permease